MRHLRMLVAPKDLRPLWSVVLPLAQRIINRTWKSAVGASPHCLIHWAPTDLDRGLFAPFSDSTVIPPLTNEYVIVLQTAYERLLDETALFVVAEQEQAKKGFVGVTPTEVHNMRHLLVVWAGVRRRSGPGLPS